MNARNTDGLMQDGPGPVISRAWSQPRLSVLGDVSGLTESGSVHGVETGEYLGMLSCSWDINPRMQFNMC